jgi:hypothetical protein
VQFKVVARKALGIKRVFKINTNNIFVKMQNFRKANRCINLFRSLGLVYKSMRGMMTKSIDLDQWLNVTSESRDRI